MQKSKTKKGLSSRVWKWLVKKLAGRGSRVGTPEGLRPTKRRGR